MRRCAAALLRNSSTELRYSRLCPCVYARLRFGALIRRCTQSLISVAGKSFRSRTPSFNKTIRTVADFPSTDLCLAVHGKSFPSDIKQKHPTDVECFCFGNRRRRVVICAFLRPRRGCGAGLPGAQSLLSAAGKCKPFRRSAFLTNYPRLLSFSLAGCFFHTSFAKEKTHTIVRVFSFGNRRRHTLPGTCPRHTSRSSSLRRKMCGAWLAHHAMYSFCVGKIFPLPCSAF